MNIKVSYADFIRLCRVESPDDWDAGINIKPDGLYIIPPSDSINLTPEERATLTEHPAGDLARPILTFPCELIELQIFLESTGRYGCIDPFDMADWLSGKISVETSKKSFNGRSEKLTLLCQAAQKFWSNVDRDDRSTHPTNLSVITWLKSNGLSTSLADKAASILRPEWATAGRKPKE
jgi:hypothetical protein